MARRRCLHGGLLIAALALAHAAWAEALLLSGMPEVVDGDGLKLGAAVVRLHGIDAPEFAQSCRSSTGENWACGAAASKALAALVAGGRVACEPLDRDRYDRIIARCLVGGDDIGGKIIDLGLAWAFTRYSDD